MSENSTCSTTLNTPECGDNVAVAQESGIASSGSKTAREIEVTPRYVTRKIDESTWELGVAMPGVKRDDIGIALEENDLAIEASRGTSLPDDWRPLQVSRATPTVYRLNLKLGLPIDPDRVSATLKDGILTLRLPAVEAARPRRIAVN